MVITNSASRNPKKFLENKKGYLKWLKPTEKQNEKTSLHIIHVNCVVINFGYMSDFPTAIFFRQIILQPFLNQTNTMQFFNPANQNNQNFCCHRFHPQLLLVDGGQIRRILRHRQRQLLIKKILLPQCKITTIG